MRHVLCVVAVWSSLAGCGHGSEPSKGGAGSAQTTPSTSIAATTAPKVASGDGTNAASSAPAPSSPAGAAAAPTHAPPPAAPSPAVEPAPAGHDFTTTGKALLVVGACGDGPLPDGLTQSQLAKHCEAIHKTQSEYRESWVKKARAFFAEKVPSNVPKKVVYPFAGGDLSTALTVYPDADEITTMSLEPAGDPRALAALVMSRSRSAPVKVAKAAKVKPAPAKAAAPAPAPASAALDAPGAAPGAEVLAPPPRSGSPLDQALATVAYELRFLYRVNFSNTLNMIDAMRGGALPTQLIFGLSALQVHGYEVVALRYFRLDDDGNVHYLDDDEVAKAPDPTKGRNEARNRLFANAEIRFRKPGGRVQIYRHIQVNLDDEHLDKDPRVLRHLEQKGQVAAMTKAASYLLAWDSFSKMRGYLLQHVAWMVSDATGVAPKWGKPAGFEYETYGGFELPHIPAGNGIARDWREEFAAQPRRELGFRFGYYDKHTVNHLVIMRRKP
ncbi:MAG: hypothetical protein ACTHU0_13895 [Kofleriaceae bacterium]